jgi:ABC-2 type transport system ATP-binding protein
VTIDGLNPFKSSRNSLEARKKIGYFIEKVPLYQEMKVISFLQFAAELKVEDKKRRQKIVDQAVDKCSLGGVKNVYIRNLSRGYRQRVGIAQALINDPDIIVLDEPTVGLDPVQVVETRRLIKETAGDKTVIFSSHILSEVSQLTDRIIILNNGKLIADDTLGNLDEKVRSFTHIHVQIEGPAEMIVDRLYAIPGVKNVTRTRPISSATEEYAVVASTDSDISKHLCMLSWEKGWIIRQMRTRETNLESIFVSIINEDSR